MRKWQGLTKGRIALVNKVQLWLRVITVADLVNENGRTINPNKFDRSWGGQFDLNWPEGAPPTDKMWEAFQFYV